MMHRSFNRHSSMRWVTQANQLMTMVRQLCSGGRYWVLSPERYMSR